MSPAASCLKNLALPGLTDNRASWSALPGSHPAADLDTHSSQREHLLDGYLLSFTGRCQLSSWGLLRTDPVPEEGEDAAAMIGTTESLSEEEQEELRKELVKVEEEIQTLSQVLAAKEKHLAEIKRKLGINSLQELKQNIAKGWQDVTATSAYKKTSETLSQAGQKASAAFSSVGSVITKKLEDVKNSPTFKSFEEKVENLKSKVGGTKPAGGDFGEVLNSTANASATTTEPLPEQTQESL
nr:tumor protein D52 isoform X6 [Vicugna pacos]XP_031548160.1 tumor protein D52 isoform X7 [Vicugna pacos]